MTSSFPILSEDLAGHSARTASLAVEISVELGFRSEQQRMVWMAAHLHDVGKVKIPDSILNLPRSLTGSEETQVRKHPEFGFMILDGLVALKLPGRCSAITSGLTGWAIRLAWRASGFPAWPASLP